MTVAELIELLKGMPQDAPVMSEGCDCIEPAGGVSMLGESVVVERSDDD